MTEIRTQNKYQVTLHWRSGEVENCFGWETEVVEVQSDGFHPQPESIRELPGTRYRPQERGIGHSEQIADAASHLRVALLQAHPDDDQIILEHVSEALRLLEGVVA